MIRNLRVLATDQRMDAKGEDGKPVVQRISTVTLEATPKIAEKIAVAQTIGALSLSLRSIADNDVELEHAIAAGEVKVQPGVDAKAAAPDASRHRQPADRRRLDLHGRRRRLPLPAQHHPFQGQERYRGRSRRADGHRDSSLAGAMSGKPRARPARSSSPAPSSGSPRQHCHPRSGRSQVRSHKTSFLSRVSIGTASAALIAASVATAVPAPAFGAPNPRRRSVRANDVTLSVGEGRMVRLDAPMSDLFVANDAVADVQVRSANQVYIFGKGPARPPSSPPTRPATRSTRPTSGSAHNIASVDEMLKLAMPEAQIRVTPMNGTVLLTGTVAAPDDVEEATRLVQNLSSARTPRCSSRLKSATPLQVILQVKVAEVNRSLGPPIGVNLLSHDSSGGFQFGIGQGRNIATRYTPGVGLFGGGSDLVDFVGRHYLGVHQNTVGSTLGAGKLLGVDILSALDLAENDGRVHTLAETEPHRAFGRDGELPRRRRDPDPDGERLAGTSIEYKQYGVSLAFTPTVLDGGRISMRVRPEVSEAVAEGAVQLNGFTIPSLTTRRAETTVELGRARAS